MDAGRPAETEFAPFYAGYVARVSEDDILDVLTGQKAEIAAVAAAGRTKADVRYEPGKWSVRELLSHIVDGERVFGYRAFCISRGEQAALPGFDEKDYVRTAPLTDVTLDALAAEFAVVRDAESSSSSRTSGASSSRLPTTLNRMLLSMSVPNSSFRYRLSSVMSVDTSARGRFQFSTENA